MGTSVVNSCYFCLQAWTLVSMFQAKFLWTAAWMLIAKIIGHSTGNNMMYSSGDCRVSDARNALTSGITLLLMIYSTRIQVKQSYITVFSHEAVKLSHASIDYFSYLIELWFKIILVMI